MSITKSKTLGTLAMSLIAANFAFAQSQPATTPGTAASATKEEKPAYKGTTLDKVKASGKIVIGVRANAIPLSYTETMKEDSKPIGYAVDICTNVAEKYKTANNLKNIKTEYQFITAVNRIPKLNAGDIDMECSITGNLASRRKDVDFSVSYYVSLTKMIVLTKNANSIKTSYDLKGKKVAAIKGASSVAIVDEFNSGRDMHIEKVFMNSPTDALAALKAGKVDGMIYVDSLLYSFKMLADKPEDLTILDEALDVEPEAIMIRKNDPDFKKFVNAEIINEIKSGEIPKLYQKWFLEPIAPKNKPVNIKMSRATRDLFRFPSVVVGN